MLVAILSLIVGHLSVVSTVPGTPETYVYGVQGGSETVSLLQPAGQLQDHQDDESIELASRRVQPAANANVLRGVLDVTN